MKQNVTNLKRCLAAFCCAGILHTSAFVLADEADDLWEKVKEASQVRPFPSEWQTNQPSREEIAAFQKENGELAFKAATMAREFIAKHPDHAKVEEAKASQKEMLRAAMGFGFEGAAEQMLKLELTPDETFQVRSSMVQRKAMAKQEEGREAVLLEFEKGVNELAKEFPNHAEIAQMQLFLAENLGGTKGKAIAAKLAESASNEQIKAAARGLLEKLSLLGSKLDLSFTAVDGREVNVQKMNGKVVLIDFWATWCGPCIAELPNVKAAYERLNPKGFEIVGISFDQTKGKLTSFVKKEKMPWPQYFDGQGWQNKFGQQYGINSIPAMWLVNKKGELVDMNARDNLVGKVEALLAEK